jgi:hypothetical protein
MLFAMFFRYADRRMEVSKCPYQGFVRNILEEEGDE